MSMNMNEEKGTGREQLAARLHQIADMVQSGNIQVARQSAAIQENIDFEIEFEQKPGKNKMEIEIEIKSLSEENQITSNQEEDEFTDISAD